MLKKWGYFLDGVVITLIVLWTLFLVTHSPESVIEIIGVTNGFLATFLVALLGGLATITFISIFPTLISLAAAGLNPFLLGLAAALGMTLANILFHFFGVRGSNLATAGMQKQLDHLMAWIKRSPDWFLPITIFIYIGFTPFPNNVLTISTGLIGCPYKKVLPPLFLGNLALMTITTYLASIGYAIITG